MKRTTRRDKLVAALEARDEAEHQVERIVRRHWGLGRIIRWEINGTPGIGLVARYQGGAYIQVRHRSTGRLHWVPVEAIR